jgi:hypothetical protein
MCTALSAACSGLSGPTSSPGDPGYRAARQQWIAEALVVGSAGQNAPLQLAVADLDHGEITDAGRKAGYDVAVAAIKGLERIPLTSATRAQRARAAADLSKLDAFFHVRLLTTCGVASGPAARAAARAWNSEPHDSTSGIIVAPLRRALADLDRQRAMQRADTSCYPAAIADLRNLESATRADIAASAAEFTGRGGTIYRADIGYLNIFFDWLDGLNGNQDVLTPVSAHCC